MTTLSIRGEGIAGSCCLRLLHAAGLPVVLKAVMLGTPAQKLLRDVFQREDLFDGLPRISRRVVLWGQRRVEPVSLPHSAVVVSEQELLERVHQQRPAPDAARSDFQDWTIFASRPLPPETIEHHFGARQAAASVVMLSPHSDVESCWVESLENGWLFLLPGANRTGWLLSVGDSPESLIGTSRLISQQLSGLEHSWGTFPSHPRIAFPLAASGWFACGTAALGFDPLCGDGVGNATREAILAAAAVRAIIDNGDAGSLIAHYQTRLLAGFIRHLALCREFYASGHSGPWWDRQLDDLRRGLSWCTQQLAGSDGSRYRLNGFTLEPAE
jgi:hypothetical protein